MTKPITFTSVAGAECRYARHATQPPPHPPYGTIGRGPRKQRLQQEALYTLEAAIRELGEIHPWGKPRYIVSAGAMVEQSDRRGPGDPHVRGLAYDLDAIWWGGAEVAGGVWISDQHSLVTLDAPHCWRHYISIQCVLARWFGTCLGYDYNAAHRDHWHLDVVRPVKWSSRSRADTVLLQRALDEIWGAHLAVDGVYGWRTEDALIHVNAGHGLESWAVNADWREWLLATARKGLEACGMPYPPNGGSAEG